MEGHALWRAIGLQAPALQQPFGGGDQAQRLRDLDPGDSLASFHQGGHAHADRRTRAVGDERGQGGQILVFGMEAGDGAILLDAQVDIAALGVRQADHGCNQITVWEPAAVALELDGHGLAVRDRPVHIRSAR
jgi:hypothetical protein